VGTLNGAGFSLFDYGQEKEAADFLLSIWRGLEGKSSIYRNWPPWGSLGPLIALSKKDWIF